MSENGKLNQLWARIVFYANIRFNTSIDRMGGMPWHGYIKTPAFVDVFLFSEIRNIGPIQCLRMGGRGLRHRITGGAVNY